MNITFLNIIQALACYIRSVSDSITINADFTTVLNWADDFIKVFHKRLQNNGKNWTLLRYKSIFAWFKATLYDIKDAAKLLTPYIKTDRDGWPLELCAIKHLALSGSIWIRLIMTVLRVHESIKLNVKFSPESIVDGYKGKPIEPILEDFRLFLTLWLSKFGAGIREQLNISTLVADELSFRLKAGPMGPSILTAHLCALAITTNEVYLKLFKHYCEITGNVDLQRAIQVAAGPNIIMGFSGKTDQVPRSGSNLITGKISLAAEAAGKTRLFAICNFWVQSALKPFHNRLMATLRLFISDGTFDQVAQFNRILCESKDRMVFCYDLTKATDRFPILLQKTLFSVLFGEKFAAAWCDLIASLPFEYKGNSYIWAVGQPLGALSSWAAFALTHHFIVQYSYWKTYNRIKWFNDYALLGDDIAIWDTKVAKYYLRLMNDLGVDINLSKSMSGINSGEFAKRHFHQGRNISGFGFDMLNEAKASMASWIRFLEILEAEGFTCLGAVCLLPGYNGEGLPTSLINHIHWLWTLRLSFAQHILLCTGNDIFSYSDLMEHYVLQRVELLNKQCMSSLKHSDFLKLQAKVVNISKCWGVTVKPNCLDVSFVGSELVSHPFIRYLNLRNNKIYDKIEIFHRLIQDGLFTQDSILRLSSYSQEEYIPKLNLDCFFTQNINELKHSIKVSVLSKTIKALMNR